MNRTMADDTIIIVLAPLLSKQYYIYLSIVLSIIYEYI